MSWQASVDFTSWLCNQPDNAFVRSPNTFFTMPKPTPAANTISADIDALAAPDFMTSLARGLAVLRAFSDQRRSLTMAQISHKTGIPRAAVGRCLNTLRQLGYVDLEGRAYTLKPKVLTLGYSYLSSTPLTVSTLPCLNQISRTVNESCSMAVLDEFEVLYVARAATSRIMSVALNTGSRLPAYCTSLGRVMLAHMEPAELDRYFASVTLKAWTERTVVSEARLREILAQVRADGYAIVNEELELGLRSIAVPVRGASGAVMAALNVSGQAARIRAGEMRAAYLPELEKGARELAILLP